ncbi:ATP-binding protein [Flintibacter sp.]|uniref:sensor histidine kinase n=1 Tax=Flintibacter sp. TaxID=1918624 RepID=UPI003A2060F0
MREKKRSRPEMRPVMLGTAVVLVLFLAGLLYLGVATWLQYKNSIIDKQKEQMLLITQAISENLEQYIQEAQADLESLSLAAEKLDDPDLAAGAREQLKTYADSHEGAVYDVVVLGKDGQITFRIRDSQVAQVFGSTTQEGQQVAQVQMEDKTLCLMLGGQLSQGGRLCLLIDLGNYYEKQIAQLHVGTNGYVLVKNSDGVILMHPEESQLGINVISGREELYPGVDLTSLNQLVEAQNQGGEGVMEYESYWWMDPDLPMVRKVAAWSPVHVGDDFLVVSAVMDYSDMYAPVAQGFIRLALVFLALTVCVTAMVLYLGKLMLDRQRSQAEISDLREINQALEELHRSEQAIAHQQRLQIMGTMTGGIAHEFNNLLTPILGHAELMLLDLPEDSELYDSAQEIAQAAGHCKEIIQQLSALSRKNVETVYKRPDAGEAFGRVMLNMAVNAVHAIGQKEGHIAITGRALGKEELEERGLTPPSRLWERYLCLDIRDDGCGMSSATLAQIFDPFFTTKKAGQGTGLGLSLADQIIRSHKGSITAESQVGQGSVFHILLPVAQAESIPSPALDGEQPTILLVGSSAKVLQMLSDSFRAMDVPVETARDWDEAAAVLERGAVDVLAADGGLEEERALDFCLSFQGKYPRLMKLLLVERPTREVLEAKNRGLIQGWLEKPVSAQAILEEAHRLLGEQAAGATTL